MTTKREFGAQVETRVTTTPFVSRIHVAAALDKLRFTRLSSIASSAHDVLSSKNTYRQRLCLYRPVPQSSISMMIVPQISGKILSCGYWRAHPRTDPRLGYHGLRSPRVTTRHSNHHFD